MNKTLYFLIGPKGSGKTYIGTYVHKNTDIHFLRVEPIWLNLKKNEDGWQRVIEAISECFVQNAKVVLSWDLIVENNGHQDVERITEKVKAL